MSIAQTTAQGDDKTVRAALHRALNRLGNANGHLCPKPHDNADPIMHELFVAREGEAYFKKRKDAAVLAAKELLGDSITSIEYGTEATLYSAAVYSLHVRVATPSMRIDKAAISNELAKLGLDANAREAFMSHVTKENKAAVTIKAIGTYEA